MIDVIGGVILALLMLVVLMVGSWAAVEACLRYVSPEARYYRAIRKDPR